MDKLYFTARITKEDSIYVGWCPELDISSCGETIALTTTRLKEAVDLFLEDKDAKLPNIATEFLRKPVRVNFLMVSIKDLRKRKGLCSLEEKESRGGKTADSTRILQ